MPNFIFTKTYKVFLWAVHAVNMQWPWTLALPFREVRGKALRYPNIDTKLHFRCEHGSRELRPKHWVHVACML